MNHLQLRETYNYLQATLVTRMLQPKWVYLVKTGSAHLPFGVQYENGNVLNFGVI